MNENVKYTPEMVLDIRTTYLANPSREVVEELAEKYNRNVRSIVGKLCREGIYVKQDYRTKRGEVPITKDTLVTEIAKRLEVEPEFCESLEKASKPVLRKILLVLDPSAEKLFTG